MLLSASQITITNSSFDRIWNFKNEILFESVSLSKFQIRNSTLENISLQVFKIYQGEIEIYDTWFSNVNCEVCFTIVDSLIKSVNSQYENFIGKLAF